MYEWVQIIGKRVINIPIVSNCAEAQDITHKFKQDDETWEPDTWISEAIDIDIWMIGILTPVNCKTKLVHDDWTHKQK